MEHMPADSNVICITAMSEDPNQIQAIEHSEKTLREKSCQKQLTMWTKGKMQPVDLIKPFEITREETCKTIIGQHTSMVSFGSILHKVLQACAEEFCLVETCKLHFAKLFFHSLD